MEPVWHSLPLKEANNNGRYKKFVFSFGATYWVSPIFTSGTCQSVFLAWYQTNTELQQFQLGRFMLLYRSRKGSWVAL